MSLKKRLIVSNIAMVFVPVISFLLIEIVLGYILLYVAGGTVEDKPQWFMTSRLTGLLLVITLTNGLLTYLVARSIVKRVNPLMEAARNISAGNLDFSIKSTSNDELGELAVTFEAMRLKLKDMENLQKRYEDNRAELIASISHDLKTPITTIKGYMKGLLDGITETPEKKQRYMETVFKKAAEMDELIDELFLYSKLDLNRESFHLETIDLHAYFADFIEELRFELEPGGGCVSYRSEPNASYRVLADRDKLKRVITNIVQNSMKYMDKAVKWISVRLQSEPEYVVVEIQDNGRGIAEDALPYIFDSFYRTDSSRNSTTGGSGLGLAIAKRVIEGNGGRIWAESECGAGTTIFFTLKKFAGGAVDYS